jgi:prolyl-tRNA synthetase
VLYMADDQPAVAFVRGDREANEVKVKQALGVTQLFLADAEWFAKATGLPPGYLGPQELPVGKVKAVIDHEILAMDTAVAGANSKQQHVTGLVPVRDLKSLQVADLRMAIQGDRCPRCTGLLRAFKGIEVGHVFYLGQKYSKAMDATFVAESGELKPFEMGCYGIGVTRIMAASIEQNHDQRGICWPVPLAPFEVAVVDLQGNAQGPSALAEQLYDQLRIEDVDVLLDDRDERPGVKFADADLIGHPLQIVVGKKAADGIVEVKNRHNGERFEVPALGLAAHVARSIRAARDGSRLTFAHP